ncbi:MAG: TetR/AcrR family transcriptional regulator [Pseudomonadota bacterium]
MGTKERRQREMEDRRRLILEKSRDLFFQKGYDNVSVQDICDAAEYGRSSVYALFAGKEEIYSYIYVEAMRILADMFQTIDPAGAEFNREFLKSGEIMFDFFRYHRNYFNALFHFSTSTPAHSKIPPHVLELKETEIARAAMPIIALLKRGIDSGYLREIDIEATIYICRASLVGIITSFIQKESESEEDTMRRYCLLFVETYLEGLKAR